MLFKYFNFNFKFNFIILKKLISDYILMQSENNLQMFIVKRRRKTTSSIDKITNRI